MSVGWSLVSVFLFQFNSCVCLKCAGTTGDDARTALA